MKGRAQSILAVHLLLIASMCGEACVSVKVMRDTEPPEDTFELTREQAVEVFRTLRALEPGDDVVHESEDGIVIPCPNGGDMEVVGGADHSQQTETSVKVMVDVTSIHRRCAVVTEEGDEFAVSGDPSFRDLLELTIDLLSTPPEMDRATGSLKGGFEWRIGEHGGDCAVALNLVGHSPAGNGNLLMEYHGGLCGFDVELNFTVAFGM